MRKSMLLVIGLALLLAPVGSVPLALAQGEAVLLTETRLPQSNRIKFPSIDTQGANVLIAGNAEESVVRLWSKADTATSFPNPATLGEASGKADFTSASVFVADDGTMYYAWSAIEERRVYLRVKGPADPDFSPRRTVTSSAPFPVEVEVAANEDGVFVFWRDPNEPVRYRRSLDGVNWDVATQSLFSGGATPLLDVAAGPGRRLIVGYTQGLNDRLQVYSAIWNGSGFVNERVPALLERNYANPSVALKPDGGYFIAFRSDDPAVPGVYFADRPANGPWAQPARLARGKTFSAATDVDPLGNVHLFWISDFAGGLDIFYASRRPGEQFRGPLQIDTGSVSFFNLDAAANLRDRSYGHAVAERFAGDVSVGNYFLFALPTNRVGAAGIAIEGGTELTNKATVTVSFTDLEGAPNAVRWRWGAPPTDQASDSGGFVPFNPASPTITVPIPPGASPNCSLLTLYTQLRRDATVQAAPNQDSIILDQALQAFISVSNPSPNLDPAFTRTPQAVLTIDSSADCRGISAASVSGPINPSPQTLPVFGRPFFSAAVVLTGDPGPKPLNFVATDLFGNAATVTRTITYDPTPPRLVDSGLSTTLVPDPNGTVFVDLSLQELVTQENGRLFGLVVRPTLAPAGGGAPVAGQPLVLPFTGMTSVIVTPPDGKLSLRDTINLSDAFPRESLAPGTFTLAITLIDGAGNESAESITRTVTLTKITYPLYLPKMLR